MYMVLQHKGDQAKHFSLGFTIQKVNTFSLLSAKGDALWGLFLGLYKHMAKSHTRALD